MKPLTLLAVAPVTDNVPVAGVIAELDPMTTCLPAIDIEPTSGTINLAISCDGIVSGD